MAIEGALLDPAADVPVRPPPADRRARYFRNELVPSGELRFVDATRESGLAIDGYAMGIATGDIDGDGDVDLYVSHLGHGQLWRNEGGGRFKDVSATARIREASELEQACRLWGTSASFFDADADGDLDLFVAHYLAYGKRQHKTCVDRSSAPDYCGPATFEPIADHYFRNRGDGTLEEATLAAGFGRADGPGLGTVITDFDLDGNIDLYVANDGTENQLWRGRGDGTFEDVAPLAGAAVDGNGQPEASMEVDSGDIDGDGDEDLIAVHFDPETKTLYRNSGDGFYEDATVAAGLNQKGFTSFGAGFFDFDLDGDLDLFVVNGAIHLVPDQVAAGSPLPLAQRKQFFENLGHGRYREILPEEEPVVGLSEVSRGLAFGDVDNDGDPDLLVGNNDGPLRLLRNDAPRAGRWLGLEVQLPGKSGRRDALGARVIVSAGGRRLFRRVQTGGSYLSARDPRLQIGLPAGLAEPGRAEPRLPAAADPRFLPPRAGPRSRQLPRVLPGRALRARKGEAGRSRCFSCRRRRAWREPGFRRLPAGRGRLRPRQLRGGARGARPGVRRAAPGGRGARAGRPGRNAGRRPAGRRRPLREGAGAGAGGDPPAFGRRRRLPPAGREGQGGGAARAARRRRGGDRRPLAARGRGPPGERAALPGDR